MSNLPVTKEFGVVAAFSNPVEVLGAVKKLKKEGFSSIDVYSPFPVHGVDKALGLGQSKLPWIVFACATFGCLGALSLQTWISVVDYPLNISGKPFFSLPAFIPVTFELTILLSAFGVLLGMLGLNKLPMWNHPVFEHSSFRRATNDGFFVSVASSDPRYGSTEKTVGLLKQIGATAIEVVKE